jgi:glycosyltransferase involved in cell wall biosynthesis
MTPRLSVLIPTHNPDPSRLGSVLDSLQNQTLDPAVWECLIIDNASQPPVECVLQTAHHSFSLRILHEPKLGLTCARKAGLRAARGTTLVLLDDDNIPESDYLEQVDRLFTTHHHLGCAGGKIEGRFERTPQPWQLEFLPLLAIRDFGDAPQMTPENGAVESYPVFSPVGAGMAMRRSAVAAWLERLDNNAPTDRRGTALSSSGDNDIVLSILKSGWQAGYFPELKLIHLIPASRLDPDYLARLNEGIQTSWMRVLTLHGINPWPPLSLSGAWLRQVKAWFTHRPWRSPAHHIRWRGACGHFQGRVRT